jgi:hypothetical protein
MLYHFCPDHFYQAVAITTTWQVSYERIIIFHSLEIKMGNGVFKPLSLLVRNI